MGVSIPARRLEIHRTIEPVEEGSPASSASIHVTVNKSSNSIEQHMIRSSEGSLLTTIEERRAAADSLIWEGTNVFSHFTDLAVVTGALEAWVWPHQIFNVIQ